MPVVVVKCCSLGNVVMMLALVGMSADKLAGCVGLVKILLANKSTVTVAVFFPCRPMLTNDMSAHS